MKNKKEIFLNPQLQHLHYINKILEKGVYDYLSY